MALIGKDGNYRKHQVRFVFSMDSPTHLAIFEFYFKNLLCVIDSNGLKFKRHKRMCSEKSSSCPSPTPSRRNWKKSGTGTISTISLVIFRKSIYVYLDKNIYTAVHLLCFFLPKMVVYPYIPSCILLFHLAISLGAHCTAVHKQPLLFLSWRNSIPLYGS